MQCDFSTAAFLILFPVVVKAAVMIVDVAHVLVWPRVHRRIAAAVFYARLAWAALYAVAAYKVRKWMKVEDNVKLIDRNRLEISYKFRDAEYRIRSRVRRGPAPVIRLMANDTDVTEDVLPYIGPGDDFHGISYTPADFGYESMTLERPEDDGATTLTFSKNEAIVIPR